MNRSQKRIFIPSTGPTAWQGLLAEPDKHWRTGYSARALAACWEAAQGSFPPEIQAVFRASSLPAFQEIELLLAFPEWKVDLPSQGHPSQNDLFVLARDDQGELVSVMVEGKVSEPFGETLTDWSKNGSPGKRARLAFLLAQLGLDGELPGWIRYQLLHRTVSALLEAARFRARSAAMVVHSFSPEERWFEDFAAFLSLFHIDDPLPGRLYPLEGAGACALYAGWAVGDSRFLSV